MPLSCHNRYPDVGRIDAASSTHGGNRNRVLIMQYFAYGSNMCAARLRSRTPSAMALGTARLPGYVLRFQKRGRDGSAKCDAEQTGRAADTVLGVVYHVDDAEMADLDRAEDLGEGYRRERLTVLPQGDSAEINAWTYLALPQAIDQSLSPFDWYVEYVLAGAREHQLPESYVRAIEEVGTLSDTDLDRAAFHRRVLELARRS